MKKFLLASAIAVSAVSAAVAPSQAATVVIKTKTISHPHVNHVCKTKWVTHWRHHKKVVEKVTVCKNM